MTCVGGCGTDMVVALNVFLILASAAYGLVLFVLSRVEPSASGRHDGIRAPSWQKRRGAPMPALIFVLPCLNEEKVIAASLVRLSALRYPDMQILVVDDGSDDRTAEIAARHDAPRVTVLRRSLPHAREGKGEALNAAVQYIVGSGMCAGRDPRDVVLCVLDADGRLDPHVMDEVRHILTDPHVGAVQIGVRINNRDRNLLARMQDIEFVLHTEIFQRGRRHLRSVGLGGNGQFVRLAALNSLGVRPWSTNLTEDLDIGVRLLQAGWRIEFCAAAAVHQQGIESLRPWVRQRTRWFQGHLQSWALIPGVLSRTSGRQKLDLVYNLTSPFLLFVSSLLSVGFWLSLVSALLLMIGDGRMPSPWWASAYVVTFGPMIVYGTLYWRIERQSGVSFWRVMLLMHLFPLYTSLWYLAGWRAFARAITRRNAWAKTDRVDDDAMPAHTAPLPTLDGGHHGD
ncbi:glycosyltransferase family 2 protein [Microbacterium sp. XT11]|uniref:glycosyltransferase family 2 protein n=1 Tax=Microbacterium sp. XT11 TaxID=367477 RepID=UPI00082DE107|nr:glycosyltransferase family 2 protein [Microbacterium sp. XT11]